MEVYLKIKERISESIVLSKQLAVDYRGHVLYLKFVM